MIEWRFAGDPRTILGSDPAEVVAVLRLRSVAGVPATVAIGPLGPFCATMAARAGAPAVDATLPDDQAAEALLRGLEAVGAAGRVGAGLRLVPPPGEE